MVFDDPDNFSIDFDGDTFLREALRVYLAGPLTNNDPEVEAECTLVRHVLHAEFRSFEGEHFQTYDPGQHTPPGTSHSSNEVFEIDYVAATTADLVVFHVIAPSLGVGVEAMATASSGVPRVIVYPRGTRVSRMFLGLFNPTLVSIEYSDADDLRSKLRAELPTIAERATQAAAKRRPFFEDFRNVGKFVLGQRITQKVTLEALAEQTGIHTYWLVCFERNDMLAAGMSLLQASRIAKALDCSFDGSGLVPKMVNRKSRLQLSERESLESLVDFVRGTDEWVPDQTLFTMWGTFQETYQSAVRGKEDVMRPWSVEIWRDLYLRLKKEPPTFPFAE